MDEAAIIRRPAARATSLALDMATEGPAWTCLGAEAPGRVARQVAAAVARQNLLPARRCSAALLLSSDAGVRVLNSRWRGLDKPTNVLSFPSPPPPSAGLRRNLGDIVLAEETLVREAVELGITTGDHFRHLVLHGLLHLLGYDHESDAEADVMEGLETRILAGLGVADPYADTGRSARQAAADASAGSRKRRHR